MVESIAIYAVGFLAQALFSARILIQWVLSERAGRVVSPAAYWVCSIAGSWLLFVYGWLRDDFSIIIGQFISYYIYIWNLDRKGLWRTLYALLRVVLIATPIVAVAAIVHDVSRFAAHFLHNEQVPVWLLLFGSLGQVLFTLRFVYQWLYSRYHGESSLPIGFWAMSLAGSAMIATYGLIRLDPVLIIGQSFGFVAYSRNIVIGLRTLKIARDAE